VKIIRELLLNRSGRYAVTIFFILFLISSWISNRPEPKTTRQVGSSSKEVQTLWVKNMVLWNYIPEWDSNIIYVTDLAAFDDKLLAINSLTGSTIWDIPLSGVDYLFADEQTVFTVSVTHANAYRASSGELLCQIR
jgi:hypothetical protein